MPQANSRRVASRPGRWRVACARSAATTRHSRCNEGLETEWSASGGSDGYVFEEIAENLDALGRPDEARPYFARAARELGKDPILPRGEPARLQRLIDRGAS